MPCDEGVRRVPGTDERRPARRPARGPARHAARPSGFSRRYPLLVGVLVVLASVATSALVIAGTRALDTVPDRRRPFVADRANGPVVVGSDGVPGDQRRPPLDPQPVVPASPAAPPEPGPPTGPDLPATP